MSATGRRWFNKLDLPVLLSIAEDRGLPLTLSSNDEAVVQQLSADAFALSTNGQTLTLRTPDWETRLDMARVCAVCAVRNHRCDRQVTELCCLDGDRRCLWTLGGPTPGIDPGGMVWERLLDALTTAAA
ncbi:MAG: hypothetical protein KDH88_08340 [Chromatiales bacterium]|nr:hypothetical protein [Chromatiales bacterium]